MLPRGLLKEHYQLLSIILRGLDIAAIIIAGLGAYFYRFGDLNLSSHYFWALVLAAGVTFFVFPIFKIYESIRGKGFWQYMRNLLQAIITVLLLLAGVAFLTKTGVEFSRIWFTWWAAFSAVLLILFRCVLFVLLRLMRSYGWNERCVVIIGAGELGHKLIETVQQSLWTGFRIIALFDDFAKDKSSHIAGIPVVQTPKNMSQFLNSARDQIDEIWMALPLRAEKRVKELLFDLRHQTIAIRFVLDIFGMDLLNHSVTDIAGIPAVNLNTSPMVGINRLVKAIEDRMLAACILLCISPIFLFIALSIKLTSKGPVFFKQLRHGWDGRIIKVYKFRTMIQHEDTKVTQATQNDARITPVGRILRRTSLDELPQFFNVLQGRMSIVGPRPHAISHNEFYKDSIKAYMQRHKVKPGITGWAQVNGWRGETETLEKMQKRVEYDLYYIENWTLFFDLKIIFLTFFQGFVNKNAY